MPPTGRFSALSAAPEAATLGGVPAPGGREVASAPSHMKSIDELISEVTQAAGVQRKAYVVREHPILGSVFFCDLCREHIMMIPNEQPVVFCDYPQWAFHVNCQFAASIKIAEEEESPPRRRKQRH